MFVEANRIRVPAGGNQPYDTTRPVFFYLFLIILVLRLLLILYAL